MPGEDISVTINGAPATGFNYNFTTEELTGNLNLVTGANVIGITAVNGDKSVTGSYTITYKPKNIVDPNTNTTNTTGEIKTVVAPEITMISPASTTENVTSSTYMLKAKVTNVSAKANIKVTVNSAPFTGFTYSTSSQEITAVITLRAGANTVKVEATNGDKIINS
jgi:hypothetical protein